jgi:hypothetical protein
MDQADFPWRPLGRLLVANGLVSAPQLELALAEQRRTGRLLGQILVTSGYVTSLALAQTLAEQHGVELRPTGEQLTPSLSESEATTVGPVLEVTAWRPLGRILVEKGFVSERELADALSEQQEHPDRRLGEILVDKGLLTGPGLALALARQHGLDLGPEQALDGELETVIRPAAPGQAVYRVYEVAYEPTYRAGSTLYESTNFLEAADFACDFVERRSPSALEIQRHDGGKSETVWTYSETRAAAEAATRKNLVQTFGFNPTRWDTRGRFDTDTKTP